MNSEVHHVGFKAYFSGFIFFVFLTLVSYFVVVEQLLSYMPTIFVIVACAIIQSTVQLGIFLDLITEPKPRSHLHIFCLMVLILLIVLAGTFWIMYSLNDRVMVGEM
jgi:cytochrome o ubiquinol oxidase operon protein cyoD